MKKTLRFSLLSMLMMLTANTFAQTVFDFDANGKELFGLAGESSNELSDGDFTEAKTAKVGNFSITVSAGVEGQKTPNRIWSKSPKLRMYGGSMTIAGTEDIKTVIFTLAANASVAKWNEGNSASVGSLDNSAVTSVTWTGNTRELTINIGGNTQISKITINGEAEQKPDDPNPGEVPELTTCAQVLAGTDGTVYHIKGTCTEIKNTLYGNWMLKDETGEVLIYGTLDAQGNTKNFSSLGIEVGDVVEVYGPRKDYNGTIELVDVTVLSITKGSTPEVQQISVARALEIINGLEDGMTTNEVYQVKGFIVTDPDFQRRDDGSLYGNVNMDIADQAGGSPVLTVFRAKNFDNMQFTEETISSIEEGDEVVIEGKLQKFVKNDVTTPELTNGHLISVNGKTSGIVSVSQSANADTIFDLQGRRVAQPTKGLYIIGGKKQLVK